MKRIFLITMMVLASACTKAPLVGVTSSRSATGKTLLGTAYTEAVSRAGGVPVVIPAVSSREEAERVLSKLDAIVFTGGEDLSPALYGEEVLNETVHIDSVRDRSDSLLARAAIASGKRILAICRGSQLMNVMLGGSLYQDIPSQVPESIGHSGTTHMIGLEEGSALARVFGPDSLEVNSTHHQAVKDPAPGIRITARAGDGIIEAWETDRITAVQFHPEKLLQNGDEKWLEFFKYFIQ